MFTNEDDAQIKLTTSKEDEIEMLQIFFDRIDKKGHGKIDAKEIVKYLIKNPQIMDLYGLDELSSK